MAGTTKSKGALLAAAASLTKNILGAGPNAPQTVKVPQAVSEIHVSPEDMILPGTILTSEVLELAEISTEALAALVDDGHAKMIDVYAGAMVDAEAAAAAA